MTETLKGLLFIAGISTTLLIGAWVSYEPQPVKPEPVQTVVPPDRPKPPDPHDLRIDSLIHVVDSLKTNLYVREK